MVKSSNNTKFKKRYTFTQEENNKIKMFIIANTNYFINSHCRRIILLRRSNRNNKYEQLAKFMNNERKVNFYKSHFLKHKIQSFIDNYVGFMIDKIVIINVPKITIIPDINHFKNLKSFTFEEIIADENIKMNYLNNENNVLLNPFFSDKNVILKNNLTEMNYFCFNKEGKKDMLIFTETGNHNIGEYSYSSNSSNKKKKEKNNNKKDDYNFINVSNINNNNLLTIKKAYLKGINYFLVYSSNIIINNTTNYYDFNETYSGLLKWNNVVANLFITDLKDERQSIVNDLEFVNKYSFDEVRFRKKIPETTYSNKTCFFSSNTIIDNTNFVNLSTSYDSDVKDVNNSYALEENQFIKIADRIGLLDNLDELVKNNNN